MHLLFQAATPPAVWYQDPITVSTIVIAFATVINVIGALLLWRETRDSVRITRDMFEASHRPYLGVTDSKTFIHYDKQEIEFMMPLINTGTVPANDVQRELLVLIDGVRIELDRYEHQGHCVLPHLNYGHTVTLSGDKFTKAINASTVNLRLKFRYKGIEQKGYDYELEGTYYKSTNIFAITKTNST
jgi:hypothetical protein